MGLKANMSRIVDRNVEETDLPICRGILANMSTNFFDVTSTRNSSANDDLRFVFLIFGLQKIVNIEKFSFFHEKPKTNVI